MTAVVLLILAVTLLPCVLYYDYKEDRWGLVPSKGTLSVLFVITALLQSHPLSGYYHLLLIGLLFCLAGDVFLALPQDRMFRLGLFAFLTGHLFYIAAFFTTACVSGWTWGGTLMAIIASVWVYRWLKPWLGSMSRPVLVYIVVITAMVSGAWSIWGDDRLDWSGRAMVLTGAWCFYLSDVFVARDRFVKKEALNRMIGLPLYYAGQFLLALSVGRL
jgi:uncharacterized membrane protein YhhN